ncbi:response regulator [Candidatus Bipolaricaulota sp. J31]
MPRVLIVEDEIYFAQTMIWAFSLPPAWEVIHVDNGFDALDYLHRCGRFADVPLPDLIITCLRLPSSNGLEILMEVKKDPRLRVIPVVIWSVCEDQERCVDQAYRLGAAVYLMKPVRAREERRQALALRRLFDAVRLPRVSHRAP